MTAELWVPACSDCSLQSGSIVWQTGDLGEPNHRLQLSDFAYREQWQVIVTMAGTAAPRVFLPPASTLRHPDN